MKAEKETKPEQDEETEELTVGEVAEILFSLTSVFNTLSEVDEMVLPEDQREQLKRWKRKIWKTIKENIDLL
jgi:glutathionyl-hydroquinone reductase